MEKIKRALRAAQHELTTLHGLVVVDGAAPLETFSIDTSEANALIDEALVTLGGEGMASNQEETIQVKDALREFILRVSTGNMSISAEETTVLPQIVRIYFEVFGF